MSQDNRPAFALVAMTCFAFGSAITFSVDHLTTPKPIIIADATPATPQPDFVTAPPDSTTDVPAVQVGLTASATATEPGHGKGKRSKSGRRGSKKIPASIIHINSATLEEFEELPGVGPSTAQRIIDYRTQYGGFQSVDELGDIPRMGAKKLAQITPYVAL